MENNFQLELVESSSETFTESQVSSPEGSLNDSSPTTTTTSPPEVPEIRDYFTSPPEAAGHARNIGSSPSGSPAFILVIGGLGYIGSHTVLELLKASYNVIVVDNLSNCQESVLTDIQKLAANHCKSNGTQLPLLHFHCVDYRSQSMRFLLESYSELVSINSDDDDNRQLKRYSRIASVIHFAAYKSVAESINKPLQYYKNNVSGLVSLLQLLEKYSIHNFIFSSSATVYGTKANSGVPLREEDLIHHPETEIDEKGNSTVLEPVSAGLTCPYARTKFFSEAILADLAVADPKWQIVALRYFNPVGGDSSGMLGENPRNTPTNLYPVLGRVLSGSQPTLKVFGSNWPTRDGTAIRDFIHVRDVARGHIAALRNKASSSGFRVYNLGSGKGTTVLEAVRGMEIAAGRDIPLQWTDRRPGDVGLCLANTERATRELGWVPQETIAQCAADQWQCIQKLSGSSLQFE